MIGSESRTESEEFKSESQTESTESEEYDQPIAEILCRTDCIGNLGVVNHDRSRRGSRMRIGRVRGHAVSGNNNRGTSSRNRCSRVRGRGTGNVGRPPLSSR